MEKVLRSFITILFPFICIILTNETMRPNIVETPFQANDITAINSAKPSPTKCSWHCHNNTQYCKDNHVKISPAAFPYTDPLYFGLINMLQNTGKYAIANLFLLAVIMPMVIYFLLIKSLNLRSRIKILKSKTK